jgi:glyoxylase-like metal-dependent hydrolase (beta-lactamase superfamily II)
VAERIAPGVLVVPHRVVDGKNGAVWGARRALAVDCGSDPAEGQAVLDALAGAGRRPDWLVYTHSHEDHAGGSGPFRAAGVTAVAQAAAPEGLRRLVARRADREGTAPAAVAAGLQWPEVLFEGELRLDLGGRTARLLPAPGHSPDSACVFLEPDGILFAGDTAVTGIPPAFGSGDGRVLAASLRRLTELEAEVLVPGHGPVLRGAAAVREWLTWLAGYLDALAAAALAAVAALPPEARPAPGAAPPEALVAAVLAAAPAGRLVGDRLPLAPTEVQRRHRDNALRAAVEALAALR